MTDLIDQFISQHQSNEVLKPYLEKLAELKQQWLSLTKSIAEKAKHNPEEIGAASVDYLYFPVTLCSRICGLEWHKLPMKN